MKYLKIFSLFAVLHVVAWGVAHLYIQNNNKPVLIVVDTSFAMKTKFPSVQQWIKDYAEQNRYKKIIVGTDKVMLGELDQLQSMNVIFRTSFGKLQQSNLSKNYSQVDASEKILLSDGVLDPSGWKTVEF